MAGFYVVAAALMLIAVLAVIMMVFELLSVLSIVFSAISLSKSKKYIILGGRYDFGSIKRFHTAALVFFIFGCINALFFAVNLIFSVTSYAVYEWIESILWGSIPLIFGAGKYTALMVLGISSFRRFAQAKKLWESLCLNSRINGARYFTVNKACPKCGSENNAGYKFCTMCGERLDQ